MRPPLADDAFEFHAAGVVEHRLTVVGGQAFGEADTALNFAQEARQCRAHPYVHLAFLDGLEYWSCHSIIPEETRARANALSGTGLVAFHILGTSMALKKKSMLTSPTLVLIRPSLDFPLLPGLAARRVS